MEIASDFAGPGTFVNQDALVANQYPRTVRTSTHPGYNQFSDIPFQVSLIGKLTLSSIKFACDSCC